MQNKKVHFISLGCPKNRVDTEIMLGHLQNDGFEVTEDSESADTIIVNTCGFIESAKQESISTIFEAANLKKTGQLKKLVVTGCLTQRYKEDLVKNMPEADLFVGTGEFQNISKILKDSYKGNKQKTFYNLPTYLQTEESPRVNSLAKHSAYLKISEGCKKRCAFCAIPLIRGNLQSRSLSNVLSEAKLLVAGGVKELMVISHDFTDYGWDLRKKNDAAIESPYQLLKTLADESGAQWIRVLYLYPDGISDEVIELIKTRKNLLKYFDMPLQHINNQMLKSMNRRMDKDTIVGVINKIRAEIPEAVIRTQFIVGFPGETEGQFQELLKFVEEFKFDRIGCFMYSPEEDTKAATLPDQVDEEIKQRRHHQLMSLAKKISREKHKSLRGKSFQVLVEGVSEETEFLLKGRYFGQAPEIDGLTYINEGRVNVGEIVEVRVTHSHDYDLVGEVVQYNA